MRAFPFPSARPGRDLATAFPFPGGLRSIIGQIAAIFLLILPLQEARAQFDVDSFNPGANTIVRNFAVQTDGRIVVSGDFTTLGGGGVGTITRNFIGRLNGDGTLDLSYNPGANDKILAMALQRDGKILVGGFFTRIGGGGLGTTPRNFIARLNQDGTVDDTFDPGSDGFIYALTVQPNDNILVGGGFSMIGGGGSGNTPRAQDRAPCPRRRGGG